MSNTPRNKIRLPPLVPPTTTPPNLQIPKNAQQQKSTGFYSDVENIISKETKLKLYKIGPCDRNLLWIAFSHKHTPNVRSFQIDRGVINQKVTSVLNKAKLGAVPETDFQESSYEPKVQLPYHVPPRCCPREVEVLRRKKQFNSLKLDDLLSDLDIDSHSLMPRYASSRPDSSKVILNYDIHNPAPFPSFLDLELFDNTEYDCRTTMEWVEMGRVVERKSSYYKRDSEGKRGDDGKGEEEDGGGSGDGGSGDGGSGLEEAMRKSRSKDIYKAVPGVALLPLLDEHRNLDPRLPQVTYKWVDVGVLSYHSASNKFLVQKVDCNGRVLDHAGMPTFLHADLDKRYNNEQLLINQYWVPRIRLMFRAEDPRQFAKRVAEGFFNRKKTENLLRYQMYVDCMPVEGMRRVDEGFLKRVVESGIRNPAHFKNKDSLDDFMLVLTTELQLDYNRAMNSIIFENEAIERHDLFAFVTLPDCVLEIQKGKGCIVIPEHPFNLNLNNFKFHTLLIRPEVAYATSKVKAECLKLTSMSLFNTSTMRPVKAEEFEQVQSQTSSHVSLYMRDSWIGSLRAVIRTALRDLGKGWFNLYEKNWAIYQISKMKRFMEMTKFCMQDASRYLVQDSLVVFVQMVLDACHPTLSLPDDYVWSDDALTSVFKPKRNALLTLEIWIENNEVVFSYPLAQVSTLFVTLFNKAILSVQNIPQLEKLVMEEILFPDSTYLEAAGLNEPHIEELRNLLVHAISKATIPMNAYLKLYHQYINLSQLDPVAYIRDLESTAPSDLKEIVEEYDEMVEDTKLTIPSSLVIGMFYLSVDSLKQKIIKKCKLIAQVVLDLLAKALRKQADVACEEYKLISNKLFEKAITIEDLVEKRQWIRTIPVTLDEFAGVAKKAMEDYDLIEGFNYNLSNDDFSIKYNTIGWPHKIMVQIDNTLNSLGEDEERFRKLQLADQIHFSDRIDVLSMNVSNIPGLTDISKAHEYANQCRRLYRDFKEAQVDAAKYNSREKLFNMPITIYDRVPLLLQEFEPFRLLWLTTSDWLRWHESWMNDPLFLLDGDAVEKNVNESYKTMHRCCKLFADLAGVGEVAFTVKGMIESFKPHIALIQGLRSPGMKQRHWDILAGNIGINLNLKSELTFANCLEMKLQDHVEEIERVADIASKEYSIEKVLDKITTGWDTIFFELIDYKNSDRFIIKISEEVGQMMDDHIVAIQALSFSPFKKPFEDQIFKWEAKLKTCQEVLDMWLMVQRQWLYLEPIFSSDDIVRQLPVENKRFQTVERSWKKIMKNVSEDPKVISVCADMTLLASLSECHNLLEQVEKGLSDYLETKRTAFPRFYFLSDDELLEILSQTTDPTAVQPHLKKCFENIYLVTFEADLSIINMISSDGEMVPFSHPFKPEGSVEEWMAVMENAMMMSLKKMLKECLAHYLTVDREEWILSGWAGQLVLAGSQTYWSAEVSEAIEAKQLETFHHKILGQLDSLRLLMSEGKLTSMQHKILSALIVIEVHARDVVATMVKQKVTEVTDFEWISQLRYYWEDGSFVVRAVTAEFHYGFEYLGNSGRLVITPLTDRCYLTLTGALHLKFGGAPAGPAGTGKTETTKDLAKFMAIKCVVFNCSDQLDFLAMAKFLKGLASSGSWACLDEFNRIELEVLSVVAQQITTIQNAQQQKLSLFRFEGVEIVLKNSCAIFITMNPGYAGRTELPDNLKALFRPVAMMVPDYALIAEISLFSFGFSNAKSLAKKIVITFKLSSEQLSSQDHYDFGMRAVKSVISAAENLKKQSPGKDEEALVFRAIIDVNVPKFLAEDLILFQGIVSDLFPNLNEDLTDYGIFLETLKATCIKNSLKPVDAFISKCIQLYETTVVRHGLMLLGPAGSGKTKCYEILQETQCILKGQISPAGSPFENTQTFIMNPKAISMGQLYGQYDNLTHEWTDGILSTLVRSCVSVNDNDKRWYMFDGPVDPIWSESMNTVLDDNKKLCLTSGEIIRLTDNMVMMFEAQDLAVASPATVSRCGMVYLEGSILGLSTPVDCWLEDLCQSLQPLKPRFQELFSLFLEPAIKMLRSETRQVVVTVDPNLVCSCLKVLDCLLRPFKPKDKQPVKFMNPILMTEYHIRRLHEAVDGWFIFSLVWGLGGSLNSDSRRKYSTWLKNTMQLHNLSPQFEDGASVFDHYLDDVGLSVNLDDDDDKADEEEKQVSWVHWMENKPMFNISRGTKFSDIIVPTIDTVRNAHLLHMLLTNANPVLCVGPTGTGKTLTVCDKLIKKMPENFLSEFVYFSAKTSANQTQLMIDGKLDKRRKGVYGPPVGKHLIFFIDDLNMPSLDTYGSQPPIELIRQYMDFSGWYDSQSIGEFRRMKDITFIGAMGLPGGGRNAITPRLQRHFTILSFIEMERSSKKTIFQVILQSWIDKNETVADNCVGIVDSSLNIYETLITSLLPTPNKSHYTFNLRDLSKIFQGILMMDVSSLGSLEDLIRLWYHEHQRVYADRLVNEEDRDWFEQLCSDETTNSFSLEMDQVVVRSPLLYCHSSQGPVSDKIYAEVTDHAALQTSIKELLEDYNQINVKKLNLVLFDDAIRHVCRVVRIIMQPLGNALLLGVGGSGRQSLSKLACHLCEYEMIQIELSKNYTLNDWKEDLKRIMLKAGVERSPVIFFFSDTQIKEESFLEDVSSVLSSGNIPNIFTDEELEYIYNAMKPVVLEANLQPTKTNMFTMFTKQVQSNLHSVLSMSPLGKEFRARLRQFPSLINNCTIDWFSEWPEDALESVAMQFLDSLLDLTTAVDVVAATDDKVETELVEVQSVQPEVNNNQSNQQETELKISLVNMFKGMHLCVSEASISFLLDLNRHTYVTPTFYLELLDLFRKLLSMKKLQLTTSYKRTKTGLDKLLATAEDVGMLQLELEQMQPLLEEATQVAMNTVNKIAVDTKVAEDTKIRVMMEESEADIKAKATLAIADDAEKDLNEALPALDAALASLKTLNKIDIVEVRALQRPPDGVKMVIDAVCIMKSVKPKRVMDDKGGKRDDYWDVGKSLLVEPQKFLDSLFAFDRDNISESTIKTIQPYIDNESFQPSAIAKVSKACTSICGWVRAMHKYHFVAKSVAPKREALRLAQEDLAETQRSLGVTKEKLVSVTGGLALLQKRYEECVFKKNELDSKANECEAKLDRADKLIGGLADENDRWHESIKGLEVTLENIIGDIVISAGYVAYLGVFTSEYRADIMEKWIGFLRQHNLPFNQASVGLVGTLSDSMLVRHWQIDGLPKDNLSIENGVIVQYTRRWPLFIDPQEQANKWVKTMESSNVLKVVKISDKDFQRNLENSIRFGKPCLLENVGEDLDPTLEPVLLKQIFKLDGTMVIKLGDAAIPYHSDFRFYLTTKHPNPHYTPEVVSKVTLINFTLSKSGLEGQLLAKVVAEERPDLEDAKNQLIVNSSKLREELNEIENKILFKLSSSEGNPLDDVELIDTLEASKLKSADIKSKVAISEQTEREIDETRSQYTPVAINTRILFFCVTHLSSIDPMYQYSLEWLVALFISSIRNAKASDQVINRCKSINDHFTYNLFCNVCRSLFEKDKLLFAFLLTIRTMQNDNKIDEFEYRFLLAGGSSKVDLIENPAPDWLTSRSWGQISFLSSIPTFNGLDVSFTENIREFKDIFDHSQPHKSTLPEPWQTYLTSFQKILLIKCLRPDSLTNALQDFVSTNLGEQFVESQTVYLDNVFKDSASNCPLVFILSQGTDPAADLYKFAEEMKFSKKLHSISLGQGQGPRAELIMLDAMEKGHWVFFQNCHLAPSWMPSLEKIIAAVNIDVVHKDFRLWLTSMPSSSFPAFILQNSVKMTVEPPRGIKANLLKAYSNFTEDFFKPDLAVNFKNLLFSLCMFHAVILERRKFGALGFNIAYEFTDGDLRICVSQLKMFLEEYTEIPYKVLSYTAGEINYGGRVTDDWDRRTMSHLLSDFYHSKVLKSKYNFSEGYPQITSNLDKSGSLNYIKLFPLNDHSHVFGLNDNAIVTYAQNEAFALMATLLLLQPKTNTGSGLSREEVVEVTAREIEGRIPDVFDLESVSVIYPVAYEQSMNTVLVQEIVRYNKLISVIKTSLADLFKALTGLVIMSKELELMVDSIYDNKVPEKWSAKAYPSLKPLSSWVSDLEERVAFLNHWIQLGIPTVFWISGFFFPQAFLTGVLQNYARQNVIAIDTISFEFQVMRAPTSELTTHPDKGCYIRGLFMEGAKWDPLKFRLEESRPKELYTSVPSIWLKPCADRKFLSSGIYDCPVYKTLTRAGTLSTTGHSTNFVFSIELPTNKTTPHWVKRGVAMLCALDD